MGLFRRNHRSARVNFRPFLRVTMGRVRTKTVKKAAKVIIEKYYTKLTLDFDINKKIIEEIALIPSKPLRNKIAGYVTHLMKRLQKSTVRGISIKLQETSVRRGTTTFQTSPSSRSHWTSTW